MKRIRLKNTVRLLGTQIVFHKGPTYRAFDAVNQPNWRERGLVFAEKKNGEAILLDKTEYILV